MNKKEIFKILCDGNVPELTCFEPDYIKYETYSGCGEYVSITKKDIIPGRKSDSYDEYLTFYWRCPECGGVWQLSDKMIDKYLPIDLQRELMQKYAGIADYIKDLWMKEKEQRELDIRMRNIYGEILKCKLKCREIFNSYDDSSRLYPNWDTTENILKRKLK